jgi:hypothetical protein
MNPLGNVKFARHEKKIDSQLHDSLMHPHSFIHSIHPSSSHVSRNIRGPLVLVDMCMLPNSHASQQFRSTLLISSNLLTRMRTMIHPDLGFLICMDADAADLPQDGVFCLDRSPRHVQ